MIIEHDLGGNYSLQKVEKYYTGVSTPAYVFRMP